jgi:hypothetical protein
LFCFWLASGKRNGERQRDLGRERKERESFFPLQKSGPRQNSSKKPNLFLVLLLLEFVAPDASRRTGLPLFLIGGARFAEAAKHGEGEREIKSKKKRRERFSNDNKKARKKKD